MSHGFRHGLARVRRHISPKYMKAPFLAPIARKGAFMYLSRD